MSIKAISISKTYFPFGDGAGGVRALNRVSIDINEGTCTLVRGPTGSGKSTLLALLACISPPTEGEMAFDRVHLPGAAETELSLFRERYVGFIPQSTLLIGELTLLENILAPHVFLGGRARELKPRALVLLERLGLGGKAGFLPRELSEGEKKKGMAARALLKEPLYLFGDEPVAHLDEDSARSVLGLFWELRRKGSAVVLAAHGLSRLEECMTVYELLRGEVVSCTRMGEKGKSAKRPPGTPGVDRMGRDKRWKPRNQRKP